MNHRFRLRHLSKLSEGAGNRPTIEQEPRSEVETGEDGQGSGSSLQHPVESKIGHSSPEEDIKGWFPVERDPKTGEPWLWEWAGSIVDGLKEIFGNHPKLERHEIRRPRTKAERH